MCRSVRDSRLRRASINGRGVVFGLSRGRGRLDRTEQKSIDSSVFQLWAGGCQELLMYPDNQPRRFCLSALCLDGELKNKLRSMLRFKRRTELVERGRRVSGNEGM